MVIMELEGKSRIRNKHGFTLIESALAILVIGLLTVIAMPRMLSTDKHIVRITARQMTADMRYARGLAIANVEEYIVRFTTDGEKYTKYEIFRGNGAGDPVGSPVKSMDIPADQVTCNPVGGFAGDLSFYSLGNAPIDDQIIISLAAGIHQWNISVIGATGRVWAYKDE